MKKFFGLLFVLAASTAYGQTGPQGGKVDSVFIKQVMAMQLAVKFTNNQYNSILPLYQDYRSNLSKAMAAQGDTGTKRKAVMALNKKYKKDLRKILTADQFEKYMAYQKEKREKARQFMMQKRIRGKSLLSDNEENLD